MVFFKEILGYWLLVYISGSAFQKVWWSSLIVAPIFFQAYDQLFCRDSRIYNNILRIIADYAGHFVKLGYIAFAIYGFQSRIGNWYACFIGLFIGLVVVIPLGLFNPMRWLNEKADGLFKY